MNVTSGLRSLAAFLVHHRAFRVANCAGVMLFAMVGVARADLAVDMDLGTLTAGVLTPGTTNVIGDTTGGPNNAHSYTLLNQFPGTPRILPINGIYNGSERVFQFTTTQESLFSVTLNSATGDPDFYLLDTLATQVIAPDTFQYGAAATFDFLQTPPQDGDLFRIPAGTYYLSVDAFSETSDDVNDLGDVGPFDLNINLTAINQPTNVVALGEITTAFAEFEIDTFLSDYDSEFVLYDADGVILEESIFTSPIPPGVNGSSLRFEPGLATGLPQGSYFIGIGGFDTTFANGFNTAPAPSPTPFGNAILTYGDGTSSTSSSPIATAADTVQWFSFDVGEVLGVPPENPIDLGDVEGFSFIGTINSPIGDDVDTEIALFDDAGNLISTNDDAFGGSVFQSLLNTRNQAGTYYLAVSGFNAAFSDGFQVAPGVQGIGEFQLDFTAADGTPGIATGFLGGATDNLFWYTFEVPEVNVGTAPTEFESLGEIALEGELFTLDSLGSISGIAGSLDTEMALFAADGTLVLTNDDSATSGDFTSAISLDTLAAGTYYLNLTTWDSRFADSFLAITFSQDFGTYFLNLDGVEQFTDVLAIGEQLWFEFSIGAAVNPGLQGDFNGDGFVDAADYTLWRDNLGATDESAFAEGTGNGIGGIDADDYLLWRANFGNTNAGSVGDSPSAVPEPATVCLALLGVVSAAVFARRKREA